ncbi:MAG: nucleotide exchange factor GrpE [Armatimonadetes bacterium]|nr:nucleotide exchange factor GrpE [Armatimonadota bacterium]
MSDSNGREPEENGAANALADSANKPAGADEVELAGLDEKGLRAEVERLRGLLAAKELDVAATREQMLRTQADFENYRRRQQQNLEQDKFAAREGIVGNLLPLLDNLERALDALGKSRDVASLEEGVRLILRQMAGILQKEGLSEIESDGKPFDPNLHQAVLSEERDDLEDHTIIETLQKGYKLGNRTLRPSMVKVAVGGATAPVVGE